MRNSTTWYLERKTVRIKNHCTRKNCTCGGHNASNVKRNRHHHSTMVRLLRRLDRKTWESVREGLRVKG